MSRNDGVSMREVQKAQEKEEKRENDAGLLWRHVGFGEDAGGKGAVGVDEKDAQAGVVVVIAIEGEGFGSGEADAVGVGPIKRVDVIVTEEGTAEIALFDPALVEGAAFVGVSGIGVGSAFGWAGGLFEIADAALGVDLMGELGGGFFFVGRGKEDAGGIDVGDNDVLEP